jgi:hypothetical protein
VIDRDEFVKLWGDDRTTRLQIAAHYGVNKTKLSEIAEGFGLHRHRGYRPPKHQRKDPTPEEIRERCLEIQSRWTEDRFERPMRARPRFYVGGSL